VAADRADDDQDRDRDDDPESRRQPVQRAIWIFDRVLDGIPGWAWRLRVWFHRSPNLLLEGPDGAARRLSVSTRANLRQIEPARGYPAR
jgi:hypothetical protein